MPERCAGSTNSSYRVNIGPGPDVDGADQVCAGVLLHHLRPAEQNDCMLEPEGDTSGDSALEHDQLHGFAAWMPVHQLVVCGGPDKI